MKIYVHITKHRHNRQAAFVLPTVLVLSVVLLTLGLSVFQLSSSIARSLTDQYWQRLSKQAAQAGISYMSACVDQGLSSSTWPASITQDNTCLGTALSTPQPSLHQSYANGPPADNSSAPNPYKTRFTIYKPTTGADGIPKARVVGAVDLQNSGDANGNNRTTIKTYTYEMVSIINGPTRVSTQVASGWKHSCAISDGQVFCWGSNAMSPYTSSGQDNTLTGQLGRGSTFSQVVGSTPAPTDPTSVLDGKIVTKIAAGYNTTCAVADARAYCWGDNTYGQVGDGTTTHRRAPVAVDVSGVLANKHIVDIAVGSNFTCVIASTVSSTLGKGRIYCWGRANEGQLGNGTTATSYFATPQAQASSDITTYDANVTRITAGGSHACALANALGAVYTLCWGRGTEGQLGRGSTTSSSIPVLMSPQVPGTPTSISAGKNHTCLAAFGRAYCWGANTSNGVLGNNSTAQANSYVAVNTAGVLNGKDVSSVSASAEEYTCAVANSQAYCWGADWAGTLGNDTTAATSLVPVAVNTAGVLSSKSITSIGIGWFHACAIGGNGQVYCWGRESQGQLGNSLDWASYGNTDHSQFTPIKSINTF
ncbi:hypothetical protein HY004_00675 [Candidatus Saccharibacteria bacterium]|nr:hypothetical protein [Candidatus Saccharibacteria bacterium]